MVYACKGRCRLSRLHAGAVGDRDGVGVGLDLVTNAEADIDVDNERTNAATGEIRRTAKEARNRHTILSAIELETRRWRLKIGEEEGMLLHTSKMRHD